MAGVVAWLAVIGWQLASADNADRAGLGLVAYVAASNLFWIAASLINAVLAALRTPNHVALAILWALLLGLIIAALLLILPLLLLDHAADLAATLRARRIAAVELGAIYAAVLLLNLVWLWRIRASP